MATIHTNSGDALKSLHFSSNFSAGLHFLILDRLPRISRSLLCTHDYRTEDVKRIVTMLRTMLPNIKIEVEAMVAEGDMVSAATPRPRLTRRVTWACRRPAKAIRTPAIQMFRFANGKIVEKLGGA